MADVHTVHEDEPWTEQLPDHPARTESPAFRHAKETMKAILATRDDWPFGPVSIGVQAHHGASLYWFGAGQWHLMLGCLGIEWSAQWVADLELVEKRIRQPAAAFYAGLGDATFDELAKLGYAEAREIVTTPITTPDLLARWVDSLFNSCVPLPAAAHVGRIPAGAGAHHYPRPISDIPFFQRPEWKLFVTDPESGHPVAVVPAGRGHEGQVEVLHAQPGTALHVAHARAHAQQRRLLLPSDHPITRAAVAA